MRSISAGTLGWVAKGRVGGGEVDRVENWGRGGGGEGRGGKRSPHVPVPLRQTQCMHVATALEACSPD